jgi:hypothetical protein
MTSCVFDIVMLSVNTLNVVMLAVVMLNVITMSCHDTELDIGLVICGSGNKLTCLSKQVCFVTGNSKDTNLLQNMLICLVLEKCLPY